MQLNIKKKKVSEMPLLENPSQDALIMVVDGEENYKFPLSDVSGGGDVDKAYVDEQDGLRMLTSEYVGTGATKTVKNATYATNAGTASQANNASYASNAGQANYASSAGTAGSAGTASYANNADKANTSNTSSYANNAGGAINDGSGRNISSTYQTITDNNLQTVSKTVVGSINEVNDIAKGVVDYVSANQIETNIMKTLNSLINDGILKQGITQVIDLLPGQYLSDIIQSITDASETKPYTINFYNHSKTVNWDTFTAKIHVPEYVNINFVGNINWWPNVYWPRMDFDEGLTDVNPVDKLFIGFSFDRTGENADVCHISGLPNNLSKVFFGGLDTSENEASKYQDLIDNPDDWGIGTLGLVRVLGSKEDDIRNNALYKKINGVFIDVTPEFMYCDFSGCNLTNAYFNSANNKNAVFNAANCQSANFKYSNNEEADFGSADCWGSWFNYANCQYADFVFSNCTGAWFGYANLKEARFFSANCTGANFFSANLKGADFGSANLKGIAWNNILSIAGANFKNADLTGGFNLPARINTKAKWIAECGAANVNATTKWIDGTSILS